MRWVHAAPQLFGWAAVAAVVQESVLGVQLAHTAPPCSARDDGVPKVQLLLIDRLAQRLSYYSRGDLVLVRVPGSTDEHHAMRLVATEGDWVAVPSHLDVRQIPKGRCWLEAESNTRVTRFKDSAHLLGPHPMAALDGRVLASMWPPSCARVMHNRLPRGRVVLRSHGGGASPFM